jgi:hypothetical protein
MDVVAAIAPCNLAAFPPSVEVNADIAGANICPCRQRQFSLSLEPAYSGILQRLACSERCQLDLPGFKNLEGLHIGMFLSTARGNEGGCGVPQTLVYNDERSSVGTINGSYFWRNP